MGWLPLPSALRMRLKRAWQQVGFLTAHIQTLEAERRALWRRRDPGIAQVRQLFTLRGIGVNSAWLYVMEFLPGGISDAQAGGRVGWPDPDALSEWAVTP